ncbi:MAG: efflux RND transporter periplasmic adaptor subunit [Treponema sp.]|jgi:RND family efflux transporter MFP subunit|nr:efflux RND transporter periplasmic adaptor subunit [Treponema sp.]
MSKYVFFAAIAAALVSAVSCAGKPEAEAGPPAVSMETLYTENGYPVSVRTLEAEEFSVYLKYPTVLQAQSESVAYASISDVVRKINVKVGDRVERDHVILSFSEDNQSLRQARLSYESARRAYDMSNTLFNAADISRQEFDAVRTQYEIARTSFEAASDMINVKSPITGTVTRLDVHVTENVRPGTPLFTVTGTNGFETRFFVGADEIDRVNTGARVYIGNPEQNIEGRISQVSLMMDSAKQAFPVTAYFDIPDGNGRNLVSGMGVDVAVETYHNEKALVLSRGELVKSGETYTAFVEYNGIAQQLAVKLGETSGLRYEVTEGLKEGDLLICEGQHRLEGNTRLNMAAVNTAPILSNAGK